MGIGFALPHALSRHHFFSPGECFSLIDLKESPSSPGGNSCEAATPVGASPAGSNYRRARRVAASKQKLAASAQIYFDVPNALGLPSFSSARADTSLTFLDPLDCLHFQQTLECVRRVRVPACVCVFGWHAWYRYDNRLTSFPCVLRVTGSSWTSRPHRTTW